MSDQEDLFKPQLGDQFVDIICYRFTIITADWFRRVTKARKIGCNNCISIGSFCKTLLLTTRKELIDMTLCNDDDSEKSCHVKSCHVNAYLNKTLDEQSVADFDRHMRHMENFTDSFLYEFDIKKIYAVCL
jgi:Fe-S-cluster-containing hydrogenase component 2